MDDIAFQRDPIEVCNHQGAPWLKSARNFDGDARAIEPVPALAGRNHLRKGVWQTSVPVPVPRSTTTWPGLPISKAAS
jgi:hypothetical protein